jgi:hypothetical protein
MKSQKKYGISLNGTKLLVGLVSILFLIGLGASTDLNNIETITPYGSNPIDITGTVDMNGNAINSIGGLQNCGTDQFIAGDGTCTTDSVDPDTVIQDDQQLSISGHTISLDNGGSVTVPDNTIPDDQNLEDVRSRNNNINGDIDFQSSGDLVSVNNLNVNSINSNKGSDPVDMDQGIDMDGSNIIDDSDNEVNVNDDLSVSQTLTASGGFRLPVGADAY